MAPNDRVSGGACSSVEQGSIGYIPTKAIKENGRTVVVPLNETAKAILCKYSKLPDDRLLPFIPTQQYNERIREVLEDRWDVQEVQLTMFVTRKIVAQNVAHELTERQQNILDK